MLSFWLCGYRIGDDELLVILIWSPKQSFWYDSTAVEFIKILLAVAVVISWWFGVRCVTKLIVTVSVGLRFTDAIYVRCSGRVSLDSG